MTAMGESEHETVSTGTTPAAGGETAEQPARVGWVRRVRAVLIAAVLGAAVPWAGLAVSYNDGVQFMFFFGFFLILLLPVYLGVAYGLWRLGRWFLRRLDVPRPAIVSGLAIAALIGVILQAENDMLFGSYNHSSHGAGWILSASEVWVWRCGAMSLAGAVACGLAAANPRPWWRAWTGAGVLVSAFLVLVLNEGALVEYQERHLVRLEVDKFGSDFAVVDGGGWEPAWVDEFGTLAYSNDAGQEAHLEFSSMELREGCDRVACEQHGDMLVVPHEEGTGEEVRVPLSSGTIAQVGSEADTLEVAGHVREATPQDEAELAETLEGNGLLQP
ncbi:hypothetical protein F4561_004406 [Lipingzhangella halophila]|uniref:Uncharacterized protein n=1 Tax=Lipingzhangella halophila TaxID=1783352 RepID=A0A7W7W4A1_9ACTN|nr:hypothetical protein [Lipingzhangella halophila]MBB4933586.1 hypothetical protein [Lipingzhangella halophila]